MEAIPVAVRARIIKLYGDGKRTKEIADALGYCPAENLISKAKAYLKKVARRRVDALGRAIEESLKLVTAGDCAGFFRHCGYAAT